MTKKTYKYYKNILRSRITEDGGLNESPILPEDSTGYSNAFIFPEVYNNATAYNDPTTYYSYYTSIRAKIVYDLEVLESLEVNATSYVDKDKVNDIMTKHRTSPDVYDNVYVEFPEYTSYTRYTKGDIDLIAYDLMDDGEHLYS